MASKKTSKPAPADDNLDDLFSGITDDSKSKKSTTTKSSKAASKPAVPGKDDDIFADIESQLTEKPSSRPHTPRAGKRSTATPPITDEKAPANAAAAAAARKSTDSARSLRASFTPSATSSEIQDNEKRAPIAEQPQQEGGGWWGVFSSTANAALKQAEAAYKEIQQNEEAKKWADQVRGLSHLDVSTLKSYGTVQTVLLIKASLTSGYR